MGQRVPETSGVERAVEASPGGAEVGEEAEALEVDGRAGAVRLVLLDALGREAGGC